MKNKIGILTLTEGINYGNKLQNYALKTYLEKKYLNYKIETIDNRISTMSRIVKMKIFIKSLIPIKENYFLLKRKFKTAKFNKKYLSFGSKMKKKRIDGEYDILICGSDQIWNPYYFNDIKYMMGYLFNQTYIISYAASFGVDKIPSDKVQNYKNSIEKVKKISVREEEGVNIVRNQLNREAVSVIDPTLLLNYNDWMKFEKKPKIQGGKYIVTYFLGEVSSFTESLISNISRKNNFKIIALNNKKNSFYSIDPQEFIYLIHNAEYVFTDSFHATVFSIIFKKKFSVYNRVDGSRINMSSRIKNLLHLFCLEHRLNIDNINGLNIEEDYEKIERIMELEREKASQFLSDNYEK